LPQGTSGTENPRIAFWELSFVYTNFETIQRCGVNAILGWVGRGIAY